MPIPPEFNNDLFTWFNDVVGRLSETNSELMFLRRYFPQLTSAQKTSVKNLMQTRISNASTSLSDISAEIGAL